LINNFILKIRLIIQATLILTVLFSMGAEVIYAVDLFACEEVNEVETEKETIEYKGLEHDKTTTDHAFALYSNSSKNGAARNHCYKALMGLDFSKNHLDPPEFA